MHTHRNRFLVLVFAAILALPVLAAAQSTWTLDQVHSNVGFEVRHLLTDVGGEFHDFDGTIVYDAENPENSSVEVTVQAASIDTDNEKRDDHLRSEDFFAVDQYPTLSFKSTSVEDAGGDKLNVTGDFTIRGVTKRITIPVEVLGVMGDKAGFATEFVIDRQEFGVNWNRALDQGGAILGDNVTVDLDFEVDRVKEEAEAEAAE